MISDAYVDVSCDGKFCNTTVQVLLSAGARNTYLYNEDSIKRELSSSGWIVEDGKHYCDPGCAAE